MEYIGSILISVITGVLSSFFVWWLLFHYIVPKVEFGPQICKSLRKSSSCGYVYRFKYVNKGRRDIIDVEFMIRMRVKGLYKSAPTTSQIFYLKTSSSANNRIPYIPSFSRSKSRYIEHVAYEDCEFLKKLKVPKEIKEKIENKTLLLEDLLKLGTKSEFEVILFGNDAFSGTRKCFISKKYRYEDIVEGAFYTKSLLVNPSNIPNKEDHEPTYPIA